MTSRQYRLGLSVLAARTALTARLALTAGLALTAALALTAGAALAAAPLQKTQAPGYYRMTLGDFEITALSDGTFALKASEVMANIAAKELDAALSRSFLSDPIEESVNAFLINTGSKLVLIDTGAGTYFGPTLGRLLASLKASGYAPEQVDEIYLTHMHGDHIGGLLLDGKAAFPRAVVRADQKEADYWLGKANRAAAAKEAGEDFDHAAQALQPYLMAGRFKPFSSDAALLPGIRPLATPGHTPGHTVYVVESKGRTLLVWGDVMHVAAVQFPDPSVTDNYDADPVAGIAQRKKIFAEAAENRYWIAGAHLSFPGLGHLRPAGSGYIYVHAHYSSMQGVSAD
jgi:glyoxylase-like metal-dependent hydrolase (beta-lactamase superfamily II)